MPADYIKIPYLNVTPEAVPRFGVIQFTDDVDVAGTDNIFSIKAKKPDSTDGVYAIDCGNGAAAGVGMGTGSPSPGAYGQCYIPVSHVHWVMFNGTAPSTPWVDQCGPVAGQWYMSKDGTGYWFAGAHASSSGWLLVNQLGGGGSTVLLGRATTPIVAASNSLTGARTFQYKEFLTLDASVTPHTQKEATDPSTGVNRFTHTNAPVDSIVVIAKIKGENTLIGLEEVCPT